MLSDAKNCLNLNLYEFLIYFDTKNLKKYHIYDDKGLVKIFVLIVFHTLNSLFFIIKIIFRSKFKRVVYSKININFPEKNFTEHISVKLPWKRGDRVQINYSFNQAAKGVSVYLKFLLFSLKNILKSKVDFKYKLFAINENLKRPHLIYWTILSQMLKHSEIKIYYEGFFFENWLVLNSRLCNIFIRKGVVPFNLSQGINGLKKKSEDIQRIKLTSELNGKSLPNLECETAEILSNHYEVNLPSTTDLKFNGRLILSANPIEIFLAYDEFKARKDLVFCLHPDTNPKIVKFLKNSGQTISRVGLELKKNLLFFGFSSSTLIDLYNVNEKVFILKSENSQFNKFINYFWIEDDI